MKRDEYFRKAFDLYNSGKIDGAVYDAMVMNADEFCEDSDEACNLPSTYAEIEYADFDSPEARDGARFDDMNFLRYMER